MDKMIFASGCAGFYEGIHTKQRRAFWAKETVSVPQGA